MKDLQRYSAEIIAFITAFLIDLQPQLFAIGFLIIADTFTGVWNAYQSGGRKSITSNKAAQIVRKFIMYPLAIIVAKVGETYLSPVIGWVDITCGILAIIEIKSIFENISGVLGYDIWDMVKERLTKKKDGQP